MANSEDLSGYGSRTWVTKDGIRMKWSGMAISHLRNTAAFLRRRQGEELSAAYRMYSSMQGDMAEYAMESAISELEDDESEALLLIQDMLAYANWRERNQS